MNAEQLRKIAEQCATEYFEEPALRLKRTYSTMNIQIQERVMMAQRYTGLCARRAIPSVSEPGGRIIPVKLIKSVVGLCPAHIRGLGGIGLLPVIHLPFPE